ncbi:MULTISPECIES: LysR family transcriptional regulator [unclassified Microbacterium]|uniref:LysR family transcriptional regulator n=1 Tax=unclassified Microbacterium TaxID=2609290 RepID=UPI000C2C8A2C|nr:MULTISPECIES: LysR family transcriptional regulator [unclassified Microbacterium]
MSLRKMEYLLAVVEHQSFTIAAQQLHITQSGLSQQIHALEENLGVRLLERLARGVRLTAAGEAFAKHAEIALAAERRAFSAVEDYRAGRAGRIDIATVYSVTVNLLPGALRVWSARMPDVSVRIQEFQHRTLLEEAARTGTFDLAIGPEPDDWDGPLDRLGAEPFVLVLPREHPLRDQIVPYEQDHVGAPARSLGRLPTSVLHGQTWVMLNVPNGLHDHVDSHLAAAGLGGQRVALRTSQMDGAARLAAAGLGLALLPEHAVVPGLDALICEPDPPLRRHMAAFAKTEYSEMVQLLVRTIASTREVFAGKPTT